MDRYNNDSSHDRKRLIKEAEFVKKIASLSIVLGTFCVAAAIFLVPLIFNQVQKLESELQNEMEFCSIRATMFASEFSKIPPSKFASPTSRQKRGDTPPELDEDAKHSVFHVAFPGHFGDASLGVHKVKRSCCSCSYGPAGDPGAQGPPGIAGKDGQPGRNGLPGPAADQPAKPHIDWCFDCPQPPAGRPGTPGNKGENGKAGKHGIPGRNGKPGKRGQCGEMGERGPQGPPGSPGPVGKPGILKEVEGRPGPPGQPGVKGPVGPPGERGNPGNKGQQGEQGPLGEPGFEGPPGPPGNLGPRGPPGENGRDGDCSHCPLPRTQPGY